MQTHLRRRLLRGRQRLKRLFNRIAGPFAVLVLRVIRLADPFRSVEFGGRWARRIGPWLPEHRVGRANLVAAFPERSAAEIDAILAGVWDNLGRTAFEFAHLDRLWDFDPARPEAGRMVARPGSTEVVERLRRAGRPALVFAAHLANWELPALGAAALGFATAVLYRAPNLTAVDEAVRNMRATTMGRLIPTGLGAPIAAARLLESGVHVGILVDQHFSKGVEVTFFGRRCLANPLIAMLARQVECPIHGIRAIRLPNHRFEFEITEAIVPPRDAQGQIDLAATMQLITQVVEGWIREYPEQWLWLHRRWR